MTSPDDLATASKGKLKYTVKCKKENATSSVLVKIPYNIYGVALAVSPKPIPNPSTNTTFTLEVLPEKGKAIESCEVALPMYDTTQSKWVVDTESVEAWKAASKVSGKKNTFRLRNTTLAGHLSPSDRMKMESNVCIEELPFRARCQHETTAGEAVTYVGGTGAETGEANEIDVNLWPRDSSISLTPSKRRITGPNDPFGLIFEPEGDLHSCSFTVNGRATDYFNPVLIEGTPIWPKLTPESLGITEILAAQASTSFTVKVTCETKVSYNNNGLGMCPQASVLSDSVVIDYEPVNPTVAVSVTSHSEVTATGGSITVRYERKATEQPPLSCMHSEFLDGTWTVASSVWPPGKSLVDNTVVTRTYNIPSSLDGVNELRFDALCTYANGDEASSRASVPVKIPVVVDISASKTDFACPLDAGTVRKIGITYERLSGTATSCDYLDQGDTDWQGLSGLASTRTVSRRSQSIPSCSTLSLGVGESVDFTYQVRCYPARNSRNSASVTVTVTNQGLPQTPPIVHAANITHTGVRHMFSAYVSRVPGITKYQVKIGRPSHPDSYLILDADSNDLLLRWIGEYAYHPIDLGNDASGPLKANARYEINVRGQNDNGISPWSGSFFMEMLSGETNPEEGLFNGFRYRGVYSYGTYPPNMQLGEFIMAPYIRDGRRSYATLAGIMNAIQTNPLSPFSRLLNGQWQATPLTSVLNSGEIWIWRGARATAPPQQDGKLYFNSTDEKLYYGVGGKWDEIEAQPQETQGDDGSTQTQI